MLPVHVHAHRLYLNPYCSSSCGLVLLSWPQTDIIIMMLVINLTMNQTTEHKVKVTAAEAPRAQLI